MGTTVTAAMFSSSGLIVAHVGDSRCLRVRPTSVEQLTQDHRTGGEASSLLTRAVGIGEKLEVDTVTFVPDREDYVLLCSDGLSGFVDEEQVLRVFRKHRLWESPPEASQLDLVIRELTSAARVRGSDDDITVVIARAPEGEVRA